MPKIDINKAAEMFLPFATGRDGRTLYQRVDELQNNGMLQLTN